MKPESIQCLNCRIGVLRQGKATYTQLIGRDLLIVPDVRTWECDVCGDFVYDDETLVRIELLLGSQIERPKLDHAQQPQSGSGGRTAADSKTGRAK